MKKSIALKLSLILLLFTSCYEVAKEIKDWTQNNASDHIISTQHLLEKDGIKIGLPDSFERYNFADYELLLDSLVLDNNNLKIEHARLKNMRAMEGNHYVFFDHSTYSTYTINSIPYTPISRQDAKFLLGLIRQNQDYIASTTDLTYTKITAKHNTTGNTQIFKAIYKIENTNLNHHAFQHVYFVSSNNKTVLINLSTSFNVDFDPYLEKMIL
ncbi:hypothetical protein HNV08_10645 [Winogradskyella eckloniae]|uniref:hypothetical protein n=1 Tax=Winogradskyella eckloniae TaxID=1089306 RepID=UPI00156333DE|nr:hypothetical protein [Winogradskyella eckloniae]NRD20505.1 hypothetical protein [Winogradskyella eckloniae]